MIDPDNNHHDVRPASQDDRDPYREALESYLQGAGERALQQAYEIGRTALADGVGLLDLARAHHAGLAALLSRAESPDQRATILARAAEFFAECISPYEMAQRAFQDANTALRHFNDAMEREATRIARSLHDEAGQLLVAVYIALTNLARDMPQAASAVAGIAELLDQIEEQLRRLAHELRPAILDDLGLLHAVRYLAEGFSQRSGVTITIDGALAERVSQTAETAIYRVVQESLNNVARHAQATEVSIRFQQTPVDISCRVRDNGIGFETRDVGTGPSERGFGLIGMRERVRALGGTLYIGSAPGTGTELVMTIPTEQ